MNDLIWVCIDCYEHGGNGECGPCDIAPLSLLGDTDATLGMMPEEHDCADPASHDCECEIEHFSWRSCEGCGSALGGSRHAMTTCS